MSFIPKPHEIYKHFKGNLYQIVAIATHSETEEQLVIYQALYGDFKIYARPLTMFTSRVDREKYPDVKQEFRFALQGDNSERQMIESADKDVAMPVNGAAQVVISQPEAFQAEKAVTILEQGNEMQRNEEQPEEEELTLDPMVLEFLDADEYETRLNILAGIHHRITDEMLTTMAIACDVEVDEGDIETRYESLRNCLLTLQKYECTRLH